MKQRLHERIPVSTEIRVWDEVAEELLGRLGNISYGGLLQITEHALPVDSIYQVRVEIADEGIGVGPISLGVETLWRHRADDGESCWIGMRIIDISDGDKRRLRELMDLQRP